jgi:hypothetical protein
VRECVRRCDSATCDGAYDDGSWCADARLRGPVWPYVALPYVVSGFSRTAVFVPLIRGAAISAERQVARAQTQLYRS